MNHYYKMWTDATEDRNGFIPIEANWRQVPGRDEKWAADQRSVLGEQKYLQEMECEFMGSAGTLISAMALKALAFVKPEFENDDGLKIYQSPIQHHSYVITVDTSRGKGLDYSAFTVINVTEFPYRVVATFRSNEISPLTYPAVLKRVGTHYNNAYILVEINDNGQQVADNLFEDYEYENLVSTVEIKKRMTATWQYGKGSDRGIRTTKSVKRLGCSIMKDLIEGQKLHIQDYDTIAELSTFIAKGTSYEADDGSHDDMVMCLVLFAWLSNQQFFMDISKNNIKDKLYKQKMEQIEEESLPMPISSDMHPDNGDYYVEGGTLWQIVR